MNPSQRRSPAWIDVSVPLQSGMIHWPDDPPVAIKHMLDMKHGDLCNVSTISMGSHTGTHIDAPRHFLRSGKGIDEMPLETTMGRVRVLEIHDRKSVTPQELEQHRIQRGERILFKTQNSARCWRTDTFITDFVYLSTEAAEWLAQRGVKLVGIDYLSVGGYEKNGVEVHRLLLEAGIWILEGLNLSKVQAGTYELLCLPLKIIGGDGAPTRAILRPIRTERRRGRIK